MSDGVRCQMSDDVRSSDIWQMSDGVRCQMMSDHLTSDIWQMSDGVRCQMLSDHLTSCDMGPRARGCAWSTSPWSKCYPVQHLNVLCSEIVPNATPERLAFWNGTQCNTWAPHGKLCQMSDVSCQMSDVRWCQMVWHHLTSVRCQMSDDVRWSDTIWHLSDVRCQMMSDGLTPSDTIWHHLTSVQLLASVAPERLVFWNGTQCNTWASGALKCWPV